VPSARHLFGTASLASSALSASAELLVWSQTGLVPCLKTDGLRPHHWQELDPIFQCYTLLAGILTGESNGMGLETIRMKDNGVRGLDRVIGQGRMGKY